MRVSALCPGAVPTEFQARAGMAGKDLFPRFLVRSAESVAEEGYRGLKAGRPLVVPGLANKVVPVLAGIVPRALLSRIMHSMMKDRTSQAPGV